jgi:hypothetical protein
MASEYADRKRLTFEQAEGAEPLPSQLKLKEVSPELRALLWGIFHRLLVDARERYPRDTLDGEFVQVLYDWHVGRCFRAADEFKPSYEYWAEELKLLFMQGTIRRYLALLSGFYATSTSLTN